MSDLFYITRCRATVDLKEQAEGGNGTSLPNTNVTVFLTKSYAVLTSITVTPKPVSSARYFAGVVFDESRPNPTSFQVFILDSNGARVSIPFSWQVRGAQGADQALWTPFSLGSSLKAWYDANYPESISITSGQVSQWADRSGNGLHLTQTTPSPRPGFVENAINGLSAVAFYGVDDYMEKTGISIIPRTIYAVAKWSGDSTATFARIVHMGNPTNNIAFLGKANGSNDYATFFGNGTTWNDTAGNTPSKSVANNSILGVVNSGATAIPYFNGTAQNSKVGTSSNAILLLIGAGSSTAHFWNGNIGEVLICDTALSQTDRQKLEGYLAWKWKLEANLPISHPYRYVQPLA